MSIDIPSAEDFAELTQHRHPASVTVYVAPSGSSESRSPIGRNPEAAQLSLRTAVGEGVAQLAAAEVPTEDLDRITDAVDQLVDDRDFWSTQARSLAVFVSPLGLRAFRLMNNLRTHSGVGDRFDAGPLIRATTFAHSGFVLAVTKGSVRLLVLESDASCHEVELTGLPEDLGLELQTADNEGRMDRQRADGALRPKIQRRDYCSTVQEAVLRQINGSNHPLVLAASPDLEPAYREINTYRRLVEEGITANPASLGLDDLARRGRDVLDRNYAAQLADWREQFGTLRAHGRASAKLREIAKAATAGQVDVLLFDLTAEREGTIDEYGNVTPADEPSAHTYGLADEVAARVLRTGGTVKAVRGADLPDGARIAATFRSAS
ncbi:hypothetical protein [Citricoccus sp. K5]|uniref:baeRF11 domain-containing protein n=1 Tax=Citricoccus sp. K5 TaxID=2653135 RepID=UPI0012EFDC47|nr:hypothetical protein [Citricoccus sp. K5]VXB47320.1 conserved hypothetical protein [Citricoccus sp. K5]